LYATDNDVLLGPVMALNTGCDVPRCVLVTAVLPLFWHTLRAPALLAERKDTFPGEVVAAAFAVAAAAAAAAADVEAASDWRLPPFLLRVACSSTSPAESVTCSMLLGNLEAAGKDEGGLEESIEVRQLRCLFLLVSESSVIS